MKLCVFGREEDPLSVHTVAVARDAGHEAVLVSFAGAAVSFDGSFRVAGAALEAFDAFVVRRFPNLWAQLGPADESATGAAWWKKTMQQVERSSFAQSAIIALELLGKPVANPLLQSGPYDFKPLQLAAFQRAGLPVPCTLVTNAPAEARAFRAAVPEVVAKPAMGGAETVLVDDGTDLDAIAAAPVILQERVRGDDVRVTLVGGRVLSSVAIAAGDHVDYRAGPAYRAGGAVYAEHTLPPAVQAQCIEAARICGHVLSGVDLKRGPSGYALLEANSAPSYLDIEHKTGAPITRALVDLLASRVR